MSENAVTRRGFLRQALGAAGLALGANVITPSRSRAATKQFNFYFPEVEGGVFDNQKVEIYDANGTLLATALTKASTGTTDIPTGIEDLSGSNRASLENAVNAFYDGNSNIVRFVLPYDTHGDVTLYNMLGQKVKAITEDSRFNAGANALSLDLNGIASGYYIVDVHTAAGRMAMGLSVVNGQIVGHSRSPKIVAYRPGFKEALGKASSVEEDQYKFVISHPDHFTRTVYVTSNGEPSVNLDERVVGYVHQDGVTPELFKAFCDEANFQMGSNGMDYHGLKTMIPNPKKKFWISNHGDAATYAEGGKATAEEQAYVVSQIEGINAHLKPENRIPIYVENPQNPETIPALQDGIIAVIPRNSGRFGIGAADKNADGIIDDAVIYFPNGRWNEQYKSSILQELLSAYAAPNEVSNGEQLDKKTVLLGGGLIGFPADRLMPMDIKLLKIGEQYQPKESINAILG